ncbi:MAG: T9SS type A sorting domain-containing protein, partial [Bacteroidota bacterium]
NGSSWSYETVFNDGQGVGQIQLMDEAATGPTIIYQNLAETGLALAQRTGSTWQVEDIPQPGLASDFSAVEQNGALHLCYYNPSNQNLNYGLKEAGSGWEFEVLDDQGSFVGQLPSLAADGQGNLHLAYFDRGSNSLKYGYRPQGSNWTVTTVNDTAALELTSISIATGPDNEPKIAFQDTDADSMFLAEQIDGAWSIAKLDITQTDASGRPLRLQIDDKGRPWVLYNFPTTNNELRLTRRNLAGEWLQVSVLNNQADIAGEFDLHIVEDDFYVLGRQNEPGNTGLGILSSPNGVNTSITESQLFDRLVISPNPTPGRLRVSWEQSKPAEVSLAIYNLQGQCLHPLGVTEITEPGKHQREFDLSTLNPGIYLLRFTQNGQSWMKKVIKLAD